MTRHEWKNKFTSDELEATIPKLWTAYLRWDAEGYRDIADLYYVDMQEARAALAMIKTEKTLEGWKAEL